MEEKNWYYNNGWGSKSDGYDVSTIIEQFLDKEMEYSKEKKQMKKCEVCMPDGNGKVSIGLGCVFISPTTTGFMLYSNPEGDIEIHCFADFDALLAYMQDNKLMDITQNKVANNI
jgi:hypothetical protein